MDFFLSPPLAIFAGILAALAVIFVFEVVATLAAGAGLSNLLDTLIDTHSLPDSTLTNWLLIKDVPLMVTVTGLLAGFGLTGVAVQMGANLLFGAPLPLAVAVVLAIVGAIATVRGQSLLFKKLKVVHTTALHAHEFLGQLVFVLSPTASRTLMGEAKFIDRHGQTHYLMVRPVGDETFRQGQVVELVEPTSGGYLAKHYPD
jgi:hypothetical protein